MKNKKKKNNFWAVANSNNKYQRKVKNSVTKKNKQKKYKPKNKNRNHFEIFREFFLVSSLRINIFYFSFLWSQLVLLLYQFAWFDLKIRSFSLSVFKQHRCCFYFIFLPSNRGYICVCIFHSKFSGIDSAVMYINEPYT